MLSGIPILDEWSGTIGKFYRYLYVEPEIIYGFSEEILDYIDVIEEISKEYPRFRRSNQPPEFQYLYAINIMAIEEDLERHGIEREDIPDLSDIIFWRAINLSQLGLLLRDPNNLEIYILGENRPIHVHNHGVGRRRTNLYFEESGAVALRRLAELFYGEGVYRAGGSIEVDIIYTGEKYRLVLDHEPLTHGETVAVIRKNIMNYNDLDTLLRKGFINQQSYEYIAKELVGTPSILIAGPPNTGKTTLLNAIVKRLPKGLRLLIIEEAREIEDLRYEGRHQAFYKHTSILNVKHRELQTIFNLRRSPDYVIFGEVLSDYEIRLMLDTLLMGIKVLATIHAADIDSLKKRLENAYGQGYHIPYYNIDMIIFTERDLLTGERRISNIIRPRKDSLKNISNYGIEGANSP